MPPKTPATPPSAAEKTPPKKGMNAITIGSFIVLIIIVVTFVGAPVVSSVAGAPAYSFGSYDGLEIKYSEGNYFAQQVENMSRRFEANSNGSNIDMFRRYIWRQAFDSAATQIGLEREAKQAGVIVTDAEINKAIFTYPTYAPAGKFSEELYKTTPPAENLRIRTEIASSLLIRKYLLEMAAGVKLSNGVTSLLANMKYPQRKFTFVVFEEKDFPDAQVTDYGKANAQQFRTISLGKLTVNSNEADAKKIQAEAVKGEKTFEDLIKAYSKDQSDTASALNIQAYHELKSVITNQADLDALFALKKGEISAPVKTQSGWVIYKLLENVTEPDFTAAATINTVRAYISRNEKGLVQDWLEKKAKELKASVKDGKLAEAAKAAGKTAESTDFVSLNFNNIDFLPKLSDATKNPVFSGLSANEDFYNKAWKLKAGEIADPILASPSVLVIKLDELKDGTENITEEVKNKIVDSFVNERYQELQQKILESPKFKDHFDQTFNELFKKAEPAAGQQQ